MSIRAIAVELYKAQQKIDKVEKEMETASLVEQDALKSELRAVKSEHAIIKRMLDGEKETGSFKKKFAGKGLVWR
ncbi:MAG: hypothetical protein OCC45_08465 [Desulfotalea sp.]